MGTRKFYLNIEDIRKTKTGISIGYKPEGIPTREFIYLGRPPSDDDISFIKKVYQAGALDNKEAVRNLLEIEL